MPNSETMKAMSHMGLLPILTSYAAMLGYDRMASQDSGYVKSGAFFRVRAEKIREMITAVHQSISRAIDNERRNNKTLPKSRIQHHRRLERVLASWEWNGGGAALTRALGVSFGRMNGGHIIDVDWTHDINPLGFFSTIAAFVEKGSYVDVTEPDDKTYRISFDGQRAVRARLFEKTVSDPIHFDIVVSRSPHVLEFLKERGAQTISEIQSPDVPDLLVLTEIPKGAEKREVFCGKDVFTTEPFPVDLAARCASVHSVSLALEDNEDITTVDLPRLLEAAGPMFVHGVVRFKGAEGQKMLVQRSIDKRERELHARTMSGEELTAWMGKSQRHAPGPMSSTGVQSPWVTAVLGGFPYSKPASMLQGLRPHEVETLRERLKDVLNRDQLDELFPKKPQDDASSAPSAAADANDVAPKSES